MPVTTRRADVCLVLSSTCHHAQIIQSALYSIRRLQHGIISPASDVADTYYYIYNTQKEITQKDSQGPAPIISFVCVCIILYIILYARMYVLFHL